MATQFPGEGSKGMVERIKRLLLSPAAEWAAIDAEPMTVRGIFMGWVVPLAAIGPVASLIHSLLFGWGMLGFYYRPSIAAAVTEAVVRYGMAVLSVWIIALVIDALAPNFGATKNKVAAMKAIAFTGTAGWLAGIFLVLPGFGWLALLGFYSLYLGWIGIPIVMKAPADKAPAYVVIALVLGGIAAGIAGTVAMRVTTGITGPTLLADSGTVSGTVSLPGGGSIDLGAAQAAADKMKAASARIQADAASGHSSAVPADALQAMLPVSIAGFTRGEVETQSGGVGGINGSTANARYTQGDQSFRLSLADIGAAGSLASLGGALNMQSSKTTATGYEKTEMVNGAMVNERWDNQAHSGEYSTMAASRFTVSAEGSAPSIDVLKQAVASVDASKLAALAK